MNIAFVRYDPATGRVRGIGNCDETDYPANMALYPDDAFLLGRANLDTDWVDVSTEPPAIAARPALAGFDRLTIAAGGREFARLTADRPFTITIDGDATEIAEPDADGRYAVELGGMVPAVYSVAVDCWPYLPYAAEVVAL
jgi:hypothetical protein